MVIAPWLVCRIAVVMSIRPDNGRALDDHALDRNVRPERATAAGRRRRDLVDHVHAVDDFAEYHVAVALRGWLAEVQRLVVVDVDEKLRGGRVRVAGARHRDCPWNVGKPG